MDRKLYFERKYIENDIFSSSQKFHILNEYYFFSFSTKKGSVAPVKRKINLVSPNSRMVLEKRLNSVSNSTQKNNKKFLISVTSKSSPSHFCNIDRVPSTE